MGLFDRKTEKKRTTYMTETQKRKQRYAIIDYYKKQNLEGKKFKKK